MSGAGGAGGFSLAEVLFALAITSFALLALIGVLCAGATTLALMRLMGLSLAESLGLFAGSGTSTATLQAAITTMGNDDPAVGYSVAYPFGTAGPILFLYIAHRVLNLRR